MSKLPNTVHTKPNPPRSYNIVIKATGSRCNLECGYCYYLDKEKVLADPMPGRISEGMLEEFIRQYITEQDVETIMFNWHGGEPALLGLDFYRKAVELQKKYAGDKHIENDFQTNGTLLDDEWCEFFKESGFWVGLSIDGPKDLHDQVRRSRDNSPTFDQVYGAGQLLRKHEVPFNTLSVISSANAKHPAEVYQFLTEDLGCQRLQWLPCVQHKDSDTTAHGYWNDSRMPVQGTDAAKPGNPTSVVTDWSVDPDDWGEFLCRTFDLWVNGGIGEIRINWFESLVAQWMGRPALICSLAGVCGRSLLTLERDGSLYSCDHFVYPEYKLGNFSPGEKPLIKMVYSDQQQKFGTNKNVGLPDDCHQCNYHFACHGECPKNRFLQTPSGQPGLNYLCSGIKRFLTYAEPMLQQIARQTQNQITHQVGIGINTGVTVQRHWP